MTCAVYILRVFLNELKQVQVKQLEFNDAFVKRIIPKLDYPVLRQAAESIDEAEGLPAEISSGWEEDESLLKRVHILPFMCNLL